MGYRDDDRCRPTGERDADGESPARARQPADRTVSHRTRRGLLCAATTVGVLSIAGATVSAQETDGESGAESDGPERFFQTGTEVGLRHVATDLTAPTDLAVDADGGLFVADQPGELWRFEGEGPHSAFVERHLGSGPAIDLTDETVAVGESFHGQYADQESAVDVRGLTGVALHPDFAENGRLVLRYSAPPNHRTPDGWSHVETVSEFRMAEDGASVDPDSERTLMELQTPQYDHVGGPIAFGPDGYLYVPTGDGGGENDAGYGHVDDWYDENAGGNGQDTTATGFGGVHRIDVDDRETARGRALPYAIPDDNPLASADDQLAEYYAWGFRDPSGIAFDADGRPIVTDAGQALAEEVNVVERGGNYGWNVREGSECFSTDDPGQPPDSCPGSAPEDVRNVDGGGGEALRNPVFEYPHTDGDAAVGTGVVGGHVYAAGEIDRLQGAYVFGDRTRDQSGQSPDGRLFAGHSDGDGGMDVEELVVTGSDDGYLHRFVRGFGRGPDGAVYVLVSERAAPTGDTGAVLELVPPGDGDSIDDPRRS